METHISLLDHGFVKVIDMMGNDKSIVEAARISYSNGAKITRSDEHLINYLMANNHTSPFEMCEIKLHIKAPIFVARQWMRHRTASINEISGRYSILKNEFYVPEVGNILPQSFSNKQGREGTWPEDTTIPQTFKSYLSENVIEASDIYDWANQSGVAKELSRLVLPINLYTEWFWKINLHNLFHFLKLRCDEHAQYEIRVYANAILDIIKTWVPIAHNAFVEYQLRSITLSKSASKVLQIIVAQSEVEIEIKSGEVLFTCDDKVVKITKREYDYLVSKDLLPKSIV